MMDRAQIATLHSRLTRIRTKLLQEKPFFGRLLMHLPFGYAECGTAYTNMREICFDPSFAEPMSDGELRFLLMHELMHCVLRHCTRGEGLDHEIYNVACDIVVNSLILETMNLPDYEVAGMPAMHRTPDGKEGREYTAEEVYAMIRKLLPDPGTGSEGSGGEADRDGNEGEGGSAGPDGDGKSGKKGKENGKGKGGKGQDKCQGNDTGGSGRIDSHDGWGDIPKDLRDEWEQHLKDAAGSTGCGPEVPYILRRYLKEVCHAPRTNWRQLLHDFIQNDRMDYVFTHPDKRYQDGFILPSFEEDETGDKVERLWFAIDTSGSISTEALSEAFNEIKGAMDQIGNLSGELSFFDTHVSEPTPVGSVEDLLKCKPVGGGGTSFESVFRAMGEFYGNDLPVAAIVMTDGYCSFPDESAALGVPVLWIIIDSDVEAPWGVCVHVDMDGGIHS